MTKGDEKLIEALHATIVKVKVNDSVGTGFWVAPGMIVTCAHVVSSAQVKGEMVSIFWRADSFEAIVVNYFDEEDIALLECKKSAVKHPCAILADEYLIDDELYSFGFSDDYPEGEPLTCMVEGTSNSPTLIKLKNGQVVPGFSGAPTLNRRTGAVCGVLRRTRDKTSDLGGRAVPSSIVLSAFPSIADVQHEIRKAETIWSASLTANQKMKLGIKFHVLSTLDRVAEIYALLNYDVQRNATIANHNVDLMLTRRLADIVIQRVVFMWDINTGVNQLDIYAAKVLAIGNKLQGISGTVICPNQVEDEYVVRAKSHGLQLITVVELESQLFDSSGYVNKIIREIESDPRYSLDLFVEPFVGETLFSENQPARKFFSAWIENAEEKQLTVLGDVGIGKTFLSKVVAYEAALKYRENPGVARLPIRIDLRNADRQFTLEALFISHFAKNEMRDLSFDLFRHSIRSGRVLVILDGFDEMSAKVTPQITAKNFQELARIVEGNAKVILTCRTHYFRSRSDEEEVVYGENSNYGSESARELYWDLISRRGFQIAYLREFNFSQVEQYVERVKKSKAPDAIKKIKSIYNLEELCQRPMLLEMIVKSIGKIDTKNISAAALYQVFTDAWIHRDKWRDILTPSEKCDFLEGLACLLTTRGDESIHYSVLADFIKGGVASKISDPKRLLEIDSDVRTSTFLTRDDNGNYGFAHRSYREFFQARSIRSALLGRNYDFISRRRLTPEEVGFTVDLLNMESGSIESVVSELESILTSTYQRFISENALLILVAIGKGPIWERTERSERVRLPDGIQLQDAILNQLDLHGLDARNVDFSGADLSESALTNCRFVNAKAVRTSFISSELIFSDWESAILFNADFSSANLSKASLRSSKLNGCTFVDTTLADVDVAGAELTGANYNGVTLDQVLIADNYERVPILQYLSKRADVRSSLENMLDDRDFMARVRGIVHRVATQNGDEGLADDVLQETLIVLFTRKPEIDFDNEMEVLRYIRYAAQSCSRNIFRRKEAWEISLADESFNIAEVTKVESDFDAEEVVRLLMESLPDCERLIAKLRLEGQSFLEIAKHIGMSESTIRTRWSRIRRKLRESQILKNLD
ncbi:MAG: sigma-70 family RNA polymerase sigma factor [Planctomycetota bacterium]